MRILVTGGAGFIGSSVADALLAAGHEIDILDNLSTGLRKNLPAQAKFIEMDIADEALKEVFEERQYGAVYHFAAQLDVRRSVDDPKFDTEVNVLGMLNILQLSVATGVKKVMFASSGGAIYGEQDYFPADEKHATEPASPYGINKLAGEKFLQYFNQTSGLEFVALRFSNVYGPRQNPFGEAGVIAIFSYRMFDGKQCIIFGDGKQTRDYVFIEDVVSACLKALETNYTGIVNIGTGVETDLLTIFTELKRLTGADKDAQHDPAKKGEQMRSVLNIGKVKDALGWEPQVSLQDGLAKTVEFFRNQEKV
jgi:UDP-glucose 4-epimerase